MSQEPPLIPPAPPKKRRLGCLAWFGLGALFCALLLAGLHRYGRHQRARELIERATTALMADDAASALDSLYTAHLENPDDARIAALYETVQQKWLESIDRQLATRTPAQRYLLLNEDPVHRDSRQLAEPRATAFRQFVERSAEDTRRQIDETVARAMDLVENGRFSDGWNEMETLRVCYRYPGLNDLRANFDTFYTARLLIHAGDLGQNGQTESAHRLLDQLTKDHRLAPEVQRAVLFRIDLGDYLLHANQAVLAASQGDEKTARARLEEAKVLFARLVNNPELMVFFADLPPRDRGSALIDPFNTAEAAVRILAAKTPKR